MLTYQEDVLLQHIQALSVQAQSAFGQACAWRILSFAQTELPVAALALCTRALEQAHLFVTAGRVDAEATQRLLLEFDALPELDDDSVAACAYVTRHLATGKPQEVAWAARRAYEATDLLAQESISFSQFSSTVEAELLGHPVVQGELESQARDLVQLQGEQNQWLQVILRAKENTERGHV